MDDVVSGANDLTLAMRLSQEMQQLLLKGGFQLCIFASNCWAVLEDLPPEDLQQPLHPSSVTLAWIKGLSHEWNTFGCKNTVLDFCVMVASCTVGTESYRLCLSLTLSCSYIHQGCRNLSHGQSAAVIAGPSEERKVVVLHARVEESTFEELLSLLSSLTKVCRIIAWCVRFVNNAQKRHYTISGPYSRKNCRVP
ncbi:hypothetical protein PR048_032780 [Dryococelus australis]|uniref:Uncharacterized protein n=1 Tax=Dryococelus australis TaxID=614101 RepID=A0ABQ9G364_9NEOP|nr:hypothetical protein PR048_032780 [Dryococelus australis]